ncbi:hypothetical protein MBLNU230_g2697t1 [Neophaeotheca triangularis]
MASTSSGPRQRNTAGKKETANGIPNGALKESNTTDDQHNEHPMGAPRHNPAMQLLRILAFALYFTISCLFIHFAQLLGLVLYPFARNWYYAYQALCKQYFGLLATTMTQRFSPTTIRISGDGSVPSQLHQAADGSLRVHFPERLVLMANHQIYTDWLYLWWIAYTNDPVPTHGHIYIILKESLKYVPVIGPAMVFYNFIFMARRWSKDQARLHHRLQKLNTQHSGPLSGSGGGSQLDPMWLLIFPEGSNLSANTRKSSASWAQKQQIPDTSHMLLPRSTGLAFCLRELRNTVEWVYDITMAYEGIPEHQYGQDVFTLRSVYFQGRPPKSVNLHFRRFHISTIPLDNPTEMNDWLLARWREKDALMEAFMRTGRFPSDKSAVSIEGGPEDEFKTAYINTEVRPRGVLEFLQVFMPVAAVTLVGRIAVQIIDMFTGVRK